MIETLIYPYHFWSDNNCMIKNLQHFDIRLEYHKRKYQVGEYGEYGLLKVVEHFMDKL